MRDNQRIWIAFLICVLGFGQYRAQANFFWAHNFGAQNEDRGRSLDYDAFGNIYLFGGFSDTVDFDPGSGSYILSDSGNAHSIIVKLDPSGNLLWAKNFGGGGKDIALDHDGNIYCLGGFVDTVDFDPGTGVYELSTSGMGDAYIVKLDTSGNFLWAKNIGGGLIYGESMVIDNLGSVYMTGSFYGSVDFDP